MIKSAEFDHLIKQDKLTELETMLKNTSNEEDQVKVTEIIKS